MLYHNHKSYSHCIPEPYSLPKPPMHISYNSRYVHLSQYDCSLIVFQLCSLESKLLFLDLKQSLLFLRWCQGFRRCSFWSRSFGCCSFGCNLLWYSFLYCRFWCRSLRGICLFWCRLVRCRRTTLDRFSPCIDFWSSSLLTTESTSRSDLMRKKISFRLLVKMMRSLQ